MKRGISPPFFCCASNTPDLSVDVVCMYLLPPGSFINSIYPWDLHTQIKRNVFHTDNVCILSFNFPTFEHMASLFLSDLSMPLGGKIISPDKISL